MDKLTYTFKLNNGYLIPKLGLGTANQTTKQAIIDGVLKAGYRHIDTASEYENEHIIGDALKECFAQGVKRDELFISTKIWHTEINDVQGTIKGSLKRLGVEYVDLYMVHWPYHYYATPKKPMHKLWAEMEELVDQGLTKSIGVANFNVQLIWDLLTYCRIKPVCNQIELNPQCAQPELVRFLRAKDILPIAYTPIARPGGD